MTIYILFNPTGTIVRSTSSSGRCNNLEGNKRNLYGGIPLRFQGPGDIQI